MKKLFAMTLCLSLWGILSVGTASAGQAVSTISRAEPDSCWTGIGDPILNLPCTLIPNGELEKTNQTYMWALARAGNKLWGGTGPNVLCTTSASFIGTTNSDFNGINVCEYGDSPVTDPLSPNYNPLVSDSLGDWRRPQIWQFDPDNGTQIDRTPNDPNMDRTVGFRSAGAHNGVAFLAGGSLNDGVIMYAFDSDTGAYLGSRAYPQYRTIRKWEVIKNVLYTGAGTPGSNGEILRWTGNKANPFQFAVVGSIGGVPREITGMVDGNGFTRIAASARGVYVSPPIRRSGLFRFHANRWTQIWNPQQYEGDLLISTTYGGGAIAFFDGYLWWGTVHVPGRSQFVHTDCLIPFLCAGELADDFDVELFRLTTVWRARDIGTNQQLVELVYGQESNIGYNPFSGEFEEQPTDWTPLWGPMGFTGGLSGINSYSWIMAVANGGPGGAPALFIGTLDMSLLLYGSSAIADAGADLWRIDSATTPAVLHDGNAVTGNLGNYGLRTRAVSEDGNKLYLGTASQSNLQSPDPFISSVITPGWELIEIDFDP